MAKVSTDWDKFKTAGFGDPAPNQKGMDAQWAMKAHRKVREFIPEQWEESPETVEKRTAAMKRLNAQNSEQESIKAFLKTRKYR